MKDRPERYTIGKGAHTGIPGACTMEWVSVLSLGRVQLGENGRVQADLRTPGKTAMPKCTPWLIGSLVVNANDATWDHETRAGLARFIPRLLEAGPSDYFASRLSTYGARLLRAMNICDDASSLLDWEMREKLRHHILAVPGQEIQRRLERVLDCWDKVRAETGTLNLGVERRWEPEVVDALVAELSGV